MNSKLDEASGDQVRTTCFWVETRGMSEIKTVTVRPYRVPSLNTALIITFNTNKMLNISAWEKLQKRVCGQNSRNNNLIITILAFAVPQHFAVKRGQMKLLPVSNFSACGEMSRIFKFSLTDWCHWRGRRPIFRFSKWRTVGLVYYNFEISRNLVAHLHFQLEIVFARPRTAKLSFSGISVDPLSW